MHAAAEIGAEDAAAQGIEVLEDDNEWDVIGEIPNGSAAALILLEHHWAVPLRDAIARTGGFQIADGMIGPYDLLAIGLATTEEARQLQQRKRKAAPVSSS